MKVTLQMIADQIGVTRATVSMALRNDPQISATRREEIRKVAEEMGYHPNALVSSLMTHIRQAKPPPRHTGLLYLVTGAKPKALPWPSYTFNLYFQGAAEQAALRGFHLEPFWIREPGMTEARIDKILRARGIPGVILGPKEDALPLPRLPWERLAGVMIGYAFKEPSLDRVLTNFYSSIRMAMAFLKHERSSPVRLILPELHDRNVSYLWKAGYMMERQGNERRFHAPLIVNTPEPAIDWVRRNPGCTVLGTYLVHRWLREAGLVDYEHFRFVSLNVEGQSEVTGVREASRVIGAEAADLTISRVLLNRTGVSANPHNTLIDPTWQQGAWRSVSE